MASKEQTAHNAVCKSPGNSVQTQVLVSVAADWLLTAPAACVCAR